MLSFSVLKQVVHIVTTGPKRVKQYYKSRFLPPIKHTASPVQRSVDQSYLGKYHCLFEEQNELHA
jgi:hypothetical protein